jgi:hypothetical protein
MLGLLSGIMVIGSLKMKSNGVKLRNSHKSASAAFNDPLHEYTQKSSQKDDFQIKVTRSAERNAS